MKSKPGLLVTGSGKDPHASTQMQSKLLTVTHILLVLTRIQSYIHNWRVYAVCLQFMRAQPGVQASAEDSILSRLLSRVTTPSQRDWHVRQQPPDPC